MCDSPAAGLQLFRSYIVSIEATWASLPVAVKEASPQATQAINQRMTIVTDEQANLETRWRNADVCQQLIAQMLPQDSVIAEGDRRLFEAKALAMKSANDIGARWEAGKKENPLRIDYLRAIYVTLLDDLQWFYNKRSLDRRTRSEIAKPMLVRALATVALCLVPFLVVVTVRASGDDLIGRINAEYKTTLIGGYLAVAFGALGALFSRVISFEQRYGSIDFDEAASTFVGRSLNLRQIVGSVGALVLFFAMFGDLIGGKLFPVVATIFQTGAASSAGELGKLIAWLFLAGFSERLVPDFLTRAEATASTAGRPNA